MHTYKETCILSFGWKTSRTQINLKTRLSCEDNIKMNPVGSMQNILFFGSKQLNGTSFKCIHTCSANQVPSLIKP